MWTYNHTPNTELYHHGILGQKWGVRRYQNYDGSYTKAGLERYYKSQDKYDSAKKKQEKAKQDLKSGKISNREYAATKRDTKSAKKEMKESYKKIEQANRKDKGKQLYGEGKNISDTKTKRAVAAVGIVAANTAAQKALSSLGKLDVKSSYVMNLAALATNAAVQIKYHQDIKNMRAYLYR